MLPERIDLLAGMQARLPAGLDKSCESEELSFLDREIIPRLFAEMVALLAIVQAAAHVALSTTHFVSLLVAFPLTERDTYLEIFERAKNQFFYAVNDAQVGIGILYGWLDPTQVVDAAFPEEPSRAPFENVDVTSEVLPLFAKEQVQKVVEEESCLTEVNITFHPTEEEEMMLAQEVEIVPIFHFGVEEEKLVPYISDKNPGESSMFELPPLPPPAKPPTLEVIVVSDSLDSPPATVADKKQEIAQTFPMMKQSEGEIAELPGTVFSAKDPYGEIHPPQEYRDAVAKLITTLSETALPVLLFKQGKLRDLGAKISSHHIHTLKFLECILADPRLKAHFNNIRESDAKWSGFLWERKDRSEEKGTGGALDKLAAEGKIDPYLPGFAKALHADLATLKSFAGKRDWEGMLDHLMGYKKS